MVTYKRVPIFKNNTARDIFLRNLSELRALHPFKLVGYVIMHDHVHLIINPLEPNISVLLRKLKGKSAREIIDWLLANGHASSLTKLRLNVKDREYAVWQKDSSAIDLFSHKFLQQKLRYIHMNPVRAGYCESPEDWRGSSYRAYFPHDPGTIPIEIDVNPYWNNEDIIEASVGGQARL